MKLLFINSLKGLKKKKIQMLSVILMVMLSTGIFVAMQSALDRMEDCYYKYLENQKVEHISIDYKIDYEKDISLEDLNYLKENNFKNLTDEESIIIDKYTCILESICEIDNQAFIYMVNNIFEKYEADIYIKTKGIEKIKDKYDFEFELEKNKTTKQDDTYIKLIPYDENKKINKVYLVEGKMPENENEITMLPKYASLNNIKLNDYYKIGDKKYKVVGFTYAPDYIYPLISFSSFIFDEKTNNVIYTYKNNYEQISGIEEKTFAIYYNGNIKRKFEFEEIINDKNSKKDSVTKIFNDDKITMSLYAGVRLARIASLQLEFKTDRLFAEYFLYLLLLIAIFVIAIITKKRIEDERLQIGVLKSLGYSPFSIAVSYLVYPIIGSIIGGVLGYIIGTAFNDMLAHMYISYFVIPLDGFRIDAKYITTCLFLPMITLSFLSYLIALLMLRKKPLQLLKEGTNLKVNIFSKIANKLTSILPFKYKFKYNLAFRSLSKLIIVALTSFCTGLLIVLVLIGSNLMENIVDKSFDGMGYDYLISMKTTEKEKIDGTSDYVLGFDFIVDKVIDKNNNEKKLEKDIKLNIRGLDSDNKYIELKNEKDKKINNLLTEENIIINKNLQNLYNIEIGDTISLKINEDDKDSFDYKVMDITEEYMGTTSYVDRTNLSKKLGYSQSVYTMMFSKDKKYSNLTSLDNNISSKISNVISFNDMKNNISDSIEKYNVSIYIVIFFASIMAFVIIAVIANIVVEENKKIISLMKVMGYKNKYISSIVLNIYTPVIIIAYILSIPAMINLLKKIVSVLAQDVEMTIPISLSFDLSLLGLIGLLIAYYIAIYMSKRVLNKIPLAIALKRE